MALFHQGADSALNAGIGMLQALERFNAADKEIEWDTRIGIGLNTGEL